MDIIKQQLGHSNSYLIRNNRAKSDILKNIKSKFDIDPLLLIEKSYSDKLLNTLINNDTFVCPISVGTKYLLYLTRIYNEDTTILISTSISDSELLPKMQTITLGFDSSLYNDTIIMGELLFNKREDKWVFLLERVLVYNSRFQTSNNNIGNIRLLYKIYEGFLPSYLDPFYIKPKHFVNLKNLENELKNIDYPIKGIRFYVLKNPIIFYYNTSNYDDYKNASQLLDDIDYTVLEKDKNDLLSKISSSIKINSNSDSVFNIDTNTEYILAIKLTTTYGIYKLFATGTNYELNEVGIARIKSMEVSNILHNTFKNNSNKTFYVKCIYNSIFNKFEVIELVDNNITSDYEIVNNLLKIGENIEKPNYIDELI